MVVIVAALSAGGCNPTGPSEELTGLWTASRPGGSPRDAVTILNGLTLQQTDGEVRGTACERLSGAFNRVIYQGVPVTGEYPRVAFSSAGTQFSGRLGKSGDIVGRLNNVLIRFERTTTDVCR